MKKIIFLLFILIATTSQAQVSVVGYIQTNGVANYPTHIDSMGKGGYMSMQDSFKRNAIPCLRRKYGMAVYVQNLQKLYILKDSSCTNTWVEFSGGGGGSQDLQSVLNNGHSLTNERNYQGTSAGASNTGSNVNAFGSAAAGINSADNINALGQNAARYNNKDHLNALGQDAASHNTGTWLNAFGDNAANFNSGDYVNALGQNAADSNTNAHVNALGSQAAKNNIGANVNAFGPGALKGNTGSNVSAFGSKAGTDNGNNNVVLFGENAMATEPDQVVFTNSNAKNTIISYGCTERTDKTTYIPNKNGYFMTANFPIVIDALVQDTYTIPYADNYQFINIETDKDPMTVTLPDPENNCINAGQRLIITNKASEAVSLFPPKYGSIDLYNTYPVYYRGTSTQITKVGVNETLELYSDGLVWRSLSPLPQPAYDNIDMISLANDYYIVSNGTYSITAAVSSGVTVYLPDPAYIGNGSTITLINRDTTNSQAIGAGTSGTPVNIVKLDGTTVSTIDPLSSSTYTNINGEWVQIFEQH